MGIDGKQLEDGTVAEAKAATVWTQDLIKRTGSVAMTGNLDMGGQKVTGLAAPATGTDGARLQDVQNIPPKQAARAASTANIDLSTGGELTIDGVGLSAGERCLVKDQTSPGNLEENGIYVVASGSWTRAADNDSTAEMQGAMVSILEGTANNKKRFYQTTEDVVVDTTDVVWVDIGGETPPAYQTKSNKAMAALVTSSDFDKATTPTLVTTPPGDAYVKVEINGVGVEVGDAVRTKDCYFSADSGSTAKAISAIAAGDELYWVGSVAGYELAVTDVIDAYYAV